MTDKEKIAKVLVSNPRAGKGKIAPASMSLSGPAGKRVVLATAKRVITTHNAVIKALANR